MTDRLAAFKAIINAPAEDTLKQPIIDSFSEQWCEEPLVMDKWFSTQAISPNWGSLQKVEQLIVHPNFDIKNPNKVRSVIGCFAGQNFKQFHESSGGGYRWVADQIIALDALNPQIAARISSVFNRWKKFDKQRQHLMLEQLKRISVVDGLSKDTYEIVSKALDLDR